MKKEFSTKWKASKQPRKQRKYTVNAPLHIKLKLMGCSLSKKLREKYGKRNIGIKKGDSVKILVGTFKGKEGKVNLVQVKKQRVAIDGIQRQKKDGTKVNVWFNSSNLQIQELNLDDKKRLAKLTKKQEVKDKKVKKIAEEAK